MLIIVCANALVLELGAYLLQQVGQPVVLRRPRWDTPMRVVHLVLTFYGIFIGRGRVKGMTCGGRLFGDGRGMHLVAAGQTSR